MESCDCGSSRSYTACCAPLISGERHAETPEELVRARYTAFARKSLDFVEQTHAPEIRGSFNRAEAESIAEQCNWQGLHVHKVRQQGDQAEVDYVVKVAIAGKTTPRGSISSFQRIDGEWFLLGSRPAQHIAHQRSARPGRNDPCTCGSGRKFKKCCADKSEVVS